MTDPVPRLLKHIAARFTPGEAFGLHLTVGIVLMLAFAWSFGVIVDEVFFDADMVAVDERITAWFRQHWGSGFTAPMLFITHWHSQGGVLLMAALAAIWMLRSKAHDWLLALLLSVPGGMLLNVLLKYTFERARPSFEEPLVTLATYSFPSGHASGATFLYGLVAAWLVCSWRSWSARMAVVAIAVGMVVLVALSRVYLGAHYLSDVLAGIVEGCAWVTICITAVSTLRRHRAARSA